MKIALINLPLSIDSDFSTNTNERFFSEGLALIASALIVAGYEVEIIDFAKDNCEENMRKYSSYDIFGISAMINQFASLEKAILAIRNIKPNAKIILGGPLVTSDPDLIARNLDFDFGIIGEGEKIIVDLLKNLEAPETVAGIVVKKKDGPNLLTPPRDILSSDNFLLPAFNLFDLKWYLKGTLRPHYKIIGESSILNNLMLSRGCPFHCKFCCRILGNKVRYKPYFLIEKEIRIWHKAGANFIRFQDDNFTIMPKEKLSKVLALLKELDIRWSCQGRVTSVNKERLRAMKSGGLEIIYYGFESLSLEALKKAGKEIMPADIYRAVQLTLEAGLIPGGFVIIGLPRETKKSLKKMVELVRRYRIPVTPYILCPLPGTEFFSLIKHKIKNGREFLLQCEEWEKNQIREGRLYFNLTNLPDQLLLETYLELLN